MINLEYYFFHHAQTYVIPFTRTDFPHKFFNESQTNLESFPRYATGCIKYKH